MIAFDEKFFEGEERDGFYVEKEMKQAWAAEMEVLMEVDRICRKYGIPYFADSGTLLGAVRHNGFIPWDDDIDIAMLRKDYMRFLAVAQKELPSPMLCLNVYQQEGWVEPFGRVVNGVDGISLTEEHLEKYHGCPYSVGVDIFILDDMPSTEAAFDAAIELGEWAYSIRAIAKERRDAALELQEGLKLSEEELQVRVEGINILGEKLEQQLTEFEEFCNITIDRKRDIPNQLLKVMDGLYAMYNEDSNGEVMNFSFVKPGNYQGCGRKKEWYRESIRLPFENITIPVPIDFYKVLEKAYGPKYLEPVRQWHFHNYPFYKENKRRLEEARRETRNVQNKLNRLEQLLSEVQ